MNVRGWAWALFMASGAVLLLGCFPEAAPPAVHTMQGQVVGQRAVGGALDVVASPLPAKATKPKVLLEDPLRSPSNGIKPATEAGNNASWTFVNHQFLGQDNSAGDYHLYPPTFLGQGTLADVTIDVQVSLLPATQSDGGVACRSPDNSHYYVLGISSNGTYAVYKDAIGYQKLSSGPVKLTQTNHLRLTCSGSAQPGPSDTVTLTGTVNEKTFKIRDSSSPYPGGTVYLWVGTYGRAAGGASFSRLTITEP